MVGTTPPAIMNISEAEFQARLKRAMYKTSASEVGTRASEELKQPTHGINGSFSDHLLYAGMWRNNGLGTRVDTDRFLDGSKDWMDKLN